MADQSTRPPLDRVLLVEVLLVLVLIALALAFYIVPAADGFFLPEWWVTVLLGALFFGTLAVDRWRRKRRGRQGLREVLDETRKTRTGA